jgi:hypothetical protein
MGKITQSFVNNVPLLPVTATIPINGSTSGVIDCTKYQLVAIYMPSAFTGTTITFTSSYNNEATFNPICQVGNATTYSVTVAASKHIPVLADVFLGASYIKIVSGSIEVAARDIICILRPIT